MRFDDDDDIGHLPRPASAFTLMLFFGCCAGLALAPLWFWATVR